MPTPLLNAYADELPRLTAEESLVAAQRTAVGAGSLKKGKARQIADSWNRQAGRGRHVTLRPKTREQWVAMAAGAGVGIKTVPVKPDG